LIYLIILIYKISRPIAVPIITELVKEPHEEEMIQYDQDHSRFHQSTEVSEENLDPLQQGSLVRTILSTRKELEAEKVEKTSLSGKRENKPAGRKEVTFLSVCLSYCLVFSTQFQIFKQKLWGFLFFYLFLVTIINMILL